MNFVSGFLILCVSRETGMREGIDTREYMRGMERNWWQTNVSIAWDTPGPIFLILPFQECLSLRLFS